ncbi:MAG: response regulator [Anaerolineae bacterium]|nr:response regulator [Anaerolineae bacterium]
MTKTADHNNTNKTEEKLQKIVSELENLQQITEALLGLERLDQVMHTIAKGIVDKLGYDMVLVSRYLDQEHMFTGLALYPVPMPERLERLLNLVGHPELKDAPTQYKLGYRRGQNPLLDRVLDGESMSSDFLADFFHPWVPRLAATTAQKLFGIQTLLDLPMQVKGKTIGTILAGVRSGPIAIDQQRALERVATQAAVAVENARLFEQAQQEIEERKRMEKALRNERDRTQQYLDIAEVMIVVLDKTGAISLINRGGCDILEYEEKALLGKNWFDTCLPAHVRKSVKPIFEKLIAGEIDPIEHFEYPVLTKSGEQRIVAWYNRVLTDSTGQISGTLSSGQNITEHVHAEALLRRTNSNLEAMIENTDEGILISDANALPIRFNSAYANMMKQAFGIDIKPGLQPHKLIPDPDTVAWWDALHQRALSGEKLRIEYSHEFSPGQVRYWEILYNPIIQDDQITGFTEFTRDITERKQAETSLLKASRMDATATLAGGIAHRINNLMTGVVGNAAFLKDMYLDYLNPTLRDDVQDMLNTISQSAQEASHLAKQMLAFARGGKYQPRTINLNDTIDEVLSLQVQDQALPTGIQINRHSTPDLWNVEADAAQMSQVFLNLLTNAVEAIECITKTENADCTPHAITIVTRNVMLDQDFCRRAQSIRPHPDLEPGPYVCMSIQDTGCGMSQAVLSRLFEPFFSTKFQGRGLGLAAAYGIVRNHNGHILVHSNQDCGATFEVYLPAQVDQHRSSISDSLPTPIATQDITGTETILVVEDDELVLKMITKLLARFGYSVLVATNGQEAVEIAQTFDGEIHLVLLDMGMPVMSGAEAYPFLRQARPGIKVIIYSGYELDATAKALLDAGVSAFIQKPFQMNALGAEIRKALQA